MEIKYINERPEIEKYIHLRENVGWGTIEKDIVKKSFDNTIYFISAYDDEKLIGFGRMVGDRYMFLYIQDIMILPEYQRLGIGREIVNSIIKNAEELKNESPQIRLYLGSVKGKEEFYRKLGFVTREEKGLGQAMIYNK